ncbi:hypothetical protein K1W69_10850 [Hoeflea sp. WL0058]|uniref:Uncharacterized protein n=1 Tax=Flavimaribacter sediminis TaxID=2865987 RepID=A0AAE3CZS2_9HYPH|nr:hypothetical protein [Flavimaribacter sediminis]MBW8637685.1 hypothetical protein [Flavimaribacter sediminis]
MRPGNATGRALPGLVPVFTGFGYLMRTFIVVMALFATLATAVSAVAGTSRPVDCELTVDGTTWIEGRCQYFPSTDGSFQIGNDDYFAQVDVTGRDVAEANWNGMRGATHAQSRIGAVRREGACWVRPGVRICAWALPEAETRAALAAQPDGMMLWPSFAPAACIGVEGPLEEGATPVLHNCRIPADLIFAAAADGTLSIDRHPGLCIDLEAPGMSKPPQLVLSVCRPDSTRWRQVPSADGSGPVVSDDGRCWTFPQMKTDPTARFPWVVAVASCTQDAAEAGTLNLSRD